MARREVGALAALVALFVSVAVPEAFAASMKENLRGLSGIYVSAEVINPEALEELRAGISREQLQTYVEMRLRTAGIPLMTEETWLGTPGSPLLSLQFEIYQADIGPVIFYPHSIGLKLMQEVIPVGDSDQKIPAVTWGKSILGCASPLAVPENVRTALKALMDRFINDYLAINPKK